MERARTCSCENLFRLRSHFSSGYHILPKSSCLESFFEKAKSKAHDYCWLGAAELYEQSLRMVSTEDFLKLGTIQEEIGHCLYFASMQVESRE